MNKALENWLASMSAEKRRRVLEALGDLAKDDAPDQLLSALYRAAGLPEDSAPKQSDSFEAALSRAAGLPPGKE